MVYTEVVLATRSRIDSNTCTVLVGWSCYRDEDDSIAGAGRRVDQRERLADLRARGLGAAGVGAAGNPDDRRLVASGSSATSTKTGSEAGKAAPGWSVASRRFTEMIVTAGLSAGNGEPFGVAGFAASLLAAAPTPVPAASPTRLAVTTCWTNGSLGASGRAMSSFRQGGCRPGRPSVSTSAAVDDAGLDRRSHGERCAS